VIVKTARYHSPFAPAPGKWGTDVVPSSRVAVVTGAGSGIGRAVSLSLIGDGYDVVLAGRRRESLDETALLASDLVGNALVVPTDVRNPDEIAQLFDATTKAFGRLDLLFNNAGIFGSRALLEDVPFESWSAAIETNLTGPFLCMQAAFKIMKAQHPMGGRIINNGSISAHSPRPDAVCYTATKHAMTGLTKQASLDGRKYDIVCGQIDIGNAATGLGSSASLTPEGQMDVAHVGDAVLYMANLPLDANVLFMTVMASKMPYIGRG
jgi:NAD(P)-dependent dehydrogenase (short-subunit alcohol dehydrogenase family)